MQVFFERRKEIGPGIWQYFFRPESVYDFVPGQYVSLHLAEIKDDRRGSARTFSLTSLPGEGSLSFVTKHFGLQSPYKQTLESLQPGEPGKINDAMGDLVLPKSKEMPLTFIAGGIGVASYVGMLRLLLEHREERAIYLFYCLRSRREMIFRQLLDSYPLSGRDIAIAPNRLSAENIMSSVPPNTLFYLSGSQPFVEGLLSDLESMGIPRSRIVFDYYDGYLEL